MVKFQIRIEISECPPWLYGKIIFPMGELYLKEGEPTALVAAPGLVFAQAVARVDKVGEPQTWGDFTSQEFVFRSYSTSGKWPFRCSHDTDASEIIEYFKSHLIHIADQLVDRFYGEEIRYRTARFNEHRGFVFDMFGEL